MVSGLNHWAHSLFLDKVEVYNFFNKNGSDKDKVLWEAAQKYKPKRGTITIFAHGAEDKIIGPNGEKMHASDVHEFLLKNSKIYTTTLTGYLNIEIKACLAGTNYIYGFALNLSILSPNSFVTGADTYWWSDDTLDLNGNWNTYYKGNLLYQSQSSFSLHKYIVER